ncbi:hypothetical protein QQM39_43215 [Streptomyces sp. DT2A-34]|uniref:hypothetical protein n=1 Tax=Streptomyces sp. DT2A-34 TaxID=3051182 RepID=UPI00265C7823|nr:hypothetical protein [Streptomyces sp. DT2A-34]MDO0917371.1 hypothetical protein [Streptomyces sp. DT2A-34]
MTRNCWFALLLSLHYKAIRSEIPESLPFWPFGLPSWEDAWIAYGWRGQDQYKADESARTIPIPHLRGTHPHPTPLYPATFDATAAWDAAEARLTVSLPRRNTAVLLRLDVASPT